MAQILPAKPKLIVEACLGSPDNTDVLDVDDLSRAVIALLKNEYPRVELGQDIPTTGIHFGRQLLDSIKVTDYTGDSDSGTTIDSGAVDIDVQIFRLFASTPHDQKLWSFSNVDVSTDQDESDLPQATLLSLPNVALHDIFDSLLFDDSLQRRLLYSLVRMTISPRVESLSVKILGAVEALLEKEKETFIIVFIDDIESLTPARESSLGSNEPWAALRAVNALLVALDRLRSRPNVVVLCTSNLINSMDSGFLDRVDIKQHIPLPSPKIRYEIFRSCYLDLAKCGIIAPITRPIDTDFNPDFEMLESPAGSLDTAAVESYQCILDDKTLPRLESMRLHFWDAPESPARGLWDIAEKCGNMSGRILHRLPALGLVMYTDTNPCPIEEALVALKRAVDDEDKIVGFVC